MIADALYDLVVHVGEDNYLEEWLDGAQEFEGIWPNPEYMQGTNAFLCVRQITTVLHIPFLFGYDDVVQVELCGLPDFSQLLCVLDINPGDQSVLNIQYYRLVP